MDDNDGDNGRNVAAHEVRLLVDSFYSIQHLRIENGNRIKGLARDYGVSEVEAAILHDMISGGLLRVEKDIEKRVRQFVRPMPVYRLWLGPHVKGVAEVLAGALIAGVEHPRRFETVSKLWKYCGMGLNADGGIQRRRRGEKINYSPFLKTTCWKVGESFVKIADRGYYGQMMATFKERETAKLLADGWTILPQGDIDKLSKAKVEAGRYFSQGHLHNRAKRKAVKLFLSHLWAVWREIEGLPVESPFVGRDDGHHLYAPPGWGEEAGEEKAAD